MVAVAGGEASACDPLLMLTASESQDHSVPQSQVLLRVVPIENVLLVTDFDEDDAAISASETKGRKGV